ncbi:MAG: sensor histidine kinase [Kutzneria sp.]|nr:sensor histidine kinase [Kutzneria sp.]
MKKDSDSTREYKSIRTQLVGAVLIPSISLLVLWTAAAAYLVFNPVYVKAVSSSVREASLPAVTALASSQKERQLSMTYLGRAATGLRELHDQEQQTDKALVPMRAAISSAQQHAPDELQQRMKALNDSLDRLPTIRSQIDSRTIDKSEVFNYYNTLLDAATRLFDTQARILPNVSITNGGIAGVSVFRASDMLSRSAALMGGAFSSGSLNTQEHLTYTNLVGSYHAELDKAMPFLRPDVADRVKTLTGSDPWHHLSDTENAFIERGPWTRGAGGLPISEGDWQQLTTQVSDSLVNLTIAQADEVSNQAITDANTELLDVIIGSIVALLAAVGSIVAAIRVSRTLVGKTLVSRLARLRGEALGLARQQLPDIVRRIRSGEPVDVEQELPELDYGSDEIGQVAEAFNAAQSAAVSAAVTEAQAREGVHNVFLGIAHRNQGLVHRQLKILDAMERGEEDPRQLERLFQLDHLATRARRNAENLIILGGEQPGRRWLKAVKLVDVLRAAVSETELYHRVQVERGPDIAIAGSAVADTIHLIAELVDNATSFSPPRSQVLVSSTLVARGVVVEVEDQGLGMSKEDRDRANAMMTAPPEFDAMALKADSRLGLFVIARLASRLGINVEFRVSPYGGTRAIVLIPSQILSRDVSDGPESPEHPEVPAGRSAYDLDGDDRSSGLHRQEALVESDAADSLEGTELDEFWSLSRSRLVNEVHTIEGWPSADAAQEASDVTLTDLSAITSGPLTAPKSTRPHRYSPERPDSEGVDPQWINPERVKLGEAINGENEQLQVPATDRPVLPRRSPQRSIAPQLRGDVFDEPEAEVNGGRSAEEIRNTMTAFQRGSLLGRQAASMEDQ